MNDQQTQISVIIPAYRAEKYISEAIKSTLKQSFKPFEVIVVNDGSPDNPFEVAKVYEPDI
jgi:glycosyltransferase involved in cell wall biosynthesis